jgi:protein O-mannosyl-transferase
MKKEQRGKPTRRTLKLISGNDSHRTPNSLKTPLPQSGRPLRDSLPLQNIAISFLLVLITVAVYAQVHTFEFVIYDDPDHIDIGHVRDGITPTAIRWAFTSGDKANWFPLTRLSHMLDFQLFGTDSGRHHLTNLFFHCLATLLLFAFLNRATGARWCSACVAYLFAMHPLHVESVAWVSERKDVLCAFFWFLTLWIYVRYAERPAWHLYICVLLTFCAGLMAKPMILTLPFVLLLLDVWPLRRLSLSPTTPVGNTHAIPSITWKRAIGEKVPFLIFAAISSVVTYRVQDSGGAVEQLRVQLIGIRVENALVSYVVYIAKMLDPSNLAALYPYPTSPIGLQAIGAGVVIAGVTYVVMRVVRTHPEFAVGWLWYLGTLVPVIGLVQVGVQARADRYTYVPLVGLFIMLAWGAREIVRRWPDSKTSVQALIIILCSLCIPLTWFQIRYWRNSESLYRRTIAVTDRNYIMHTGFGIVLSKAGRLPEAFVEFREALQIKPDFADAHDNLGVALAMVPGRLPEAVQEGEAAVSIAPNSYGIHYNLGVALSKTPGRLLDAISEFRAALRIKPDYSDAHLNLGLALMDQGQMPEAISEFRAVLQIDPKSASAHYDLGTAWLNTPGHLPEAASEYQEALRIDPDFANAHMNLGVVLEKIPGRLNEAILEYQAALKSNPESAELHSNLGGVLARAGRTDEALREYETAVRMKPESADLHTNLANALLKFPDRLPDALGEFEAALRIKPNPSLQRQVDQLRVAANRRRP